MVCFSTLYINTWNTKKSLCATSGLIVNSHFCYGNKMFGDEGSNNYYSMCKLNTLNIYFTCYVKYQETNSNY